MLDGPGTRQIGHAGMIFSSMSSVALALQWLVAPAVAHLDDPREPVQAQSTPQGLEKGTFP